MKRVRVGDVVRLRREVVDIDPFDEYCLVGVYSFGKGIFHREARPGRDLGDYRFFSIEPGDLVLSNIQAWEGAIAYATERDRGCVGTHRFLSYVPIDEQADANYLRFYFLSESGHALIQQASPGSVTRNRTLAIDRFEKLTIPLPDISEQRRIVARLEQLLGAASRLTELSSESRTADGALVDSAIQATLDSVWEHSVPLADIADINPSPQRTVGVVAFVPMAAVDDKLGTIARPEFKPVEEVGSGYKQFQRNDVLFARITPCMQNGKAAVMDLPDVDVGYGSTEFHVIRPGPDVLPEWIHRVVRSRRFRDAAAERFTGTAGQQRVPAEFLRSVRVPLPPPEHQRELIAKIDRIANVGAQIRAARSAGIARAQALEKSLLNAAFSGLL